MSGAAAEIVTVRAIECPREDWRWDWAEDEARRIDAHWAQTVAAAPALYDGRVLLIHRMAVEGDLLRAACFETRFSRFLAWRDFGMPDATVRNGFAMAAIEAADGGFLLGEMAAHTSNAGLVYFPAGTPDPDDLSDGRLDFEASAWRELAEETGLGPQDATATSGWSVVIERGRLACMKRMRARLDGAALLARIEARIAADPGSELARVVLLRRAAELDGLRMPSFSRVWLDRALAGEA